VVYFFLLMSHPFSTGDEPTYWFKHWKEKAGRSGANKKRTLVRVLPYLYYCLITRMSWGGLPVRWISLISAFVSLRPTKINEDVTLLKLKSLKSATFWLPRNMRNAPWKFVRENKTSGTSFRFTIFLSRKLERTLSKRNTPRSRTATPPRLKLMRRPVKFKPEKRESLTSLFHPFCEMITVHE
jgi:hypothetical protein